jgi:hypothetical protein
MAATEFDLQRAVFAYGLVFKQRLVRVPDSEVAELRWCIEDLPQTKDFAVSPCLSKCFPVQRSTVDRPLMLLLE